MFQKRNIRLLIHGTFKLSQLPQNLELDIESQDYQLYIHFQILRIESSISFSILYSKVGCRLFES